MERAPPLLFCVFAAALAACAPAQESAVPAPATSIAGAGEPSAGRPSRVVADPVETPASATSAHAGGEWMLRESYPPTAVWGAQHSEGQLVFACDQARAQLRLERHAVGVPSHVRWLSIDADGTRMDYPAERGDSALVQVLATSIALDAPILDRMLGAQRLVVTAGADAIATDAPGAALRAVVDACRREGAG